MKKYLMILIFYSLITNGYAQISNYISNVKVENPIEGESLKLTADLYNIEEIYSVEIVYKTFGKSEYKNIEMIVSGTQAKVTIPAEEVIPPFIEYYLQIQLRNGAKQTFPIGIDQGVNPIQISVSSKSEKSNQVIILSPDENEIMSENDFLISVSFVNASDKIDIAKTKIFFNDLDISSKAIYDEELITVTKEQIDDISINDKSKLEIKIFDKDGNIITTLTRNFKVVSQQIAKANENEFKYNGQIKAEARNESTNAKQILYKNILAEFNSSYNDWKIYGNTYFTSEEKNNLQPFNRYSLSIENGKLLSLKLGDNFPKISNLILEGKRVRGFSGELNLGFFNLQTSYGEINRKIEGKLLQTYSANDVPLSNDVISIDQSKYNAPYGKVIFGTFKRQLFAIRPSFGSGENFQLGFTYFHAVDDKNSIEFGTKPKENVVLGSDLKLAFDNNNILFTTQGAVSILNKDIAPGTLTDAQIDSIFNSNKDFDVDPKDVKKIRDLIGKFITVNQNLGPWNLQKLSSLGAESILSLNYFYNNIKASYIYRGNEYQSFGQSYLKTDVKGINITDRIRMLENKLFLSLGYENLEDNLQNTKLTTTKYKTYSASVSFFPRMNFPNITLGYSNNYNKNGLDYKGSQFGKYAIDETISKISLLLSYDVFYFIKHSTSFSFSNSSREINTVQNIDSRSSNISFNVTSYWDKNIVSTFGVIYNNLEYFGYQFNYLSLSFGGKYTLLDNKLTLNGNISPSFGDFKRQSIEFLANYNLLENFVVSFQARVFRIPDKSTNSIIGLITRLNI